MFQEVGVVVFLAIFSGVQTSIVLNILSNSHPGNLDPEKQEKHKRRNECTRRIFSCGFCCGICCAKREPGVAELPDADFFNDSDFLCVSPRRLKDSLDKTLNEASDIFFAISEGNMFIPRTKNNLLAQW